MKETYVEYILANCRESSVSWVCSRYKTKEELLNAAHKGFAGENRILGLWNILSHSLDIIDDGYIKVRSLSPDAKKLHLRVFNNLSTMKNDTRNRSNVDKERLFNTLVDLNWLISSYYHFDNDEHYGQILLFESPSEMKQELPNALDDLFYNQALYDIERSKQYESATKIGYQIFNGLHPDDEVREYFSRGYTYSDFERLKEQAHECGVKNMSLYFALTATAARAEQIRRLR